MAIIAILLLSLCLRLGAAVWWQRRLPSSDAFAFGDSFSYWNLGRVVAAGGPYSYAHSRVFRAPGYPALLAPLFLMSDVPPVVWARAIGAFLGTAAVAGVIGLGHQLFGARAALLAGLITAVYPGAIGMSVFVLSEAPFCPFMLLQMICWVAASRAEFALGRWQWSAVGGVAAGLANLIRPSWLLFTPAVACLALCGGRAQRRQLSIAAVMLVTTSLTMMPWWIRNYREVGAFVPTTLEIGASLYDGLNPAATGSSEMEFVERFRAELLADGQQSGPEQPAYEVRLDRAMRDASIAWAKQHPQRVFELMGVKFIRMWSPWPNASELQSARFRWLTAATYCPILLLGLWGAVKFRAGGWDYWLCLLPAVYFTGLHVIFVSSIRYRQPAMLPWIVLAAGVLAPLLWRRPCETE